MLVLQVWVYDEHAHLIIFQTFCFLDLSARESCFSPTFVVFFLPLNYVDIMHELMDIILA